MYENEKFSPTKIWPITQYYSTRTLVRFLATLKIHKKSNFDQNQLKVSM